MKIGMPILFEYNSIKENIKLAEELKFDFIELNLNFDYCQKEFENKKELLNLVKSSNLEYTLHFYDEADFASYDEVCKAYMKLLKKYLKLAKEINIKLVNIHLNVGPIVTISGIKKYLYDKNYDTYIERLINNLNKVKKMCDKYNVQMVLENTICPSFIKRTYQDLKDKFMFNYDIGHDYRNDSNLQDMFKNEGFILKEFHFHDSTKSKDHLCLGTGEMDLKSYKNMIDGQYVLLELKSSEDLELSMEYFKKI